MSTNLLEPRAWIQVLLGPRQCGKSTLFSALSAQDSRPSTEITFDDLQMRQLASGDPALFLSHYEPPLILDEVQYVPELFPELKKRIDQLKKETTFGLKNEKPSILFRLTGSSQILLDKRFKESLAGRAAWYFLNTLSVHEILGAFPKKPVGDILFRGGWPELYANPQLSVTGWLNDYIRTYVEKDIAGNAGIRKIPAFLTILQLAAARTGQEADYSSLQKDSGISSVSVKEWLGILERADLVYLLRPFFNNLSSRLIKRPKLYFLDTGLAARLQGWSERLPMLGSPQIGALFETLVVSEMIKFIRNHQKDWAFFFWRTKDGQEVDVVLQTARGDMHAFEVKYAIQGIKKSISYPAAFKRMFSPKNPLVVVTSGGEEQRLSRDCITLPIKRLYHYLLDISD